MLGISSRLILSDIIVPKYDLKEKIFGVFSHWVNDEKADLTRGLDDVFFAPHSRHTEVRREDIEKVPELEILSESEEAGSIYC